MSVRAPTPVDSVPQFTFGLEFQKGLLRLLCEDSGFAHQIAGMLSPQYFEHEALSWAFAEALRYSEQFGGMPSVSVLRDKARTIDPKLSAMYQATLDDVSRASLKDEAWLRHSVIEFVRKNLFVQSFHQMRALFNSGDSDAAYDALQEVTTRIQKVAWETADESNFFTEAAKRQNDRFKDDASGNAIPTGFATLDHILDGGLSKGEMGLWMAYAKTGKTTALVQHGVAATRIAWKNVAHFVFEGSRKLVENRYDAAFSGVLYNRVKHGDIDNAKFAALQKEYRMLGDRLRVRAFVDEWDYSVEHIHEAIKDLKTQHGWVPDLVIVDYGDLLRGRDKTYQNETAKQQAAFRDLKALANRGYALWTASQAQRPGSDADVTPAFLKSRQIADCYAKVRVADFLGSLNATVVEKQANMMCMYAELYRDNEASKAWMVNADLARMTINEKPGLVSPHGASRVAHETTEVGNGNTNVVRAAPRQAQASL